MENTVTVKVNKSIANAVALIQVLHECGAITVEDETAGMHDLWTSLDQEDKTFYTGMMKGALTAMGVRKGGTA